MPSDAGKVPRRKRKSPTGKRRRSRGQKRPPETELDMIDRHLLTRVPTQINGKVVRATILAGIMYQLLQSEIAGDMDAGGVLLQYADLTKPVVETTVELEFPDSDYSRSLAENPPEKPLEDSHD